MRKVYKGVYGDSASITMRNGKYYLTARTAYGDIYHKGTYKTFKGARIALGRLTEGMIEEVAQ